MPEKEAALGVLLELAVGKRDVAAFCDCPSVFRLRFRVARAASIDSGSLEVDTHVGLGCGSRGFGEHSATDCVVWERGSDLRTDGVCLALGWVRPIGFCASLRNRRRRF